MGIWIASIVPISSDAIVNSHVRVFVQTEGFVALANFSFIVMQLAIECSVTTLGL
jgi:hypothetical protein